MNYATRFFDIKRFAHKLEQHGFFFTDVRGPFETVPKKNPFLFPAGTVVSQDILKYDFYVDPFEDVSYKMGFAFLNRGTVHDNLGREGYFESLYVKLTRPLVICGETLPPLTLKTMLADGGCAGYMRRDHAKFPLVSLRRDYSDEISKDWFLSAEGLSLLEKIAGK